VRRLPTFAAVLAAMALLCGGPVLVIRHAMGQLFYECRNHPAVETFRYHLGPPGPDVSDVRSDGHRNTGGANVWLRFRATRAEVRTLVRGWRRGSAQEARETTADFAEMGPLTLHPPPTPALPREHQVELDGLQRIRTPEVFYKLPPEEGGSSDTIVVDRERELVYYYHSNI
jgi:hypothetical protein